MELFGNDDENLNPAYKVYIQQGEDVKIIAALGDGSTSEFTSNWEQGLSNMTLGSKYEAAGGLLQSGLGGTSQSQINTAQIWQGAQPLSINLTLQLYTLRDSWKEVGSVVKALKKLASADLGKTFINSKIPQSVSLKIGLTEIYKEMVITSISEPLSGQKDSNGNLVNCEITLQLESKTSINKSDL